jgi:DNA-binding response OmpR family regulator
MSAGVAQDRPVASVPAPAAAPRAATRVLLAEDDYEMRRLVAIALRRDGCEVIEVDSGNKLLDLLATELLHPVRQPSIDVIISDHRMPGATGLSVLMGLHKERWATPFILITAFGGQEMEGRALEQGAAAVFDKPFDMNALCAAVRRLTDRDGQSHDRRPRCAVCASWHHVKRGHGRSSRDLCDECLRVLGSMDVADSSDEALF